MSATSARNVTNFRINQIKEKDIAEGQEPSIEIVKAPDCLRPTKESIKEMGEIIDDYRKHDRYYYDDR